MAKPFLILESIDARKATVADTSRATTIARLVIPPIRFKTTTRTAGGGVMDIDYHQNRLQPIEPAMMINGFDEDLIPGEKEQWTLAAQLRQRKSGAFVPVRIEVEGVIVEWTPDEADPAQFNGCNAIMREVTHFELIIDNKEWFYADEEEREIRRMGKSLMSGRRAALGS